MKKLKWEKPVLESFDTVDTLECACLSGSNATNRCLSGSSATGNCNTSGGSAGYHCRTSGGSASRRCNTGAAPSW
ncbi:MAG: hypothetical protein GY707_00065 [Desulfobacteraceae bacterium]|nr:hypothetical protein [Desulfobacteraceae bacterium]